MKAILKTTLFATILIVALSLLSTVLVDNKDYTAKMEEFYTSEQALDIIILGNSHAYCSFDPAIINANLGVNAYNLGQGGQHIEVTYAYLEEALKYQQPQLVVVELFNARDVVKDAGVAVNLLSLNAMRPSLTQAEAIVNYLPPKYYLEALIPAVNQHHTWSSPATLADNLKDTFLPGYPFQNGYRAIDHMLTAENYQKYVDNIKELHNRFKPIPDDKLYWVEKMIALCREKDVDLMFTVSPMVDAFIKNKDYEVWSGHIREIAKEKGIPFFDFNDEYDEMHFRREHFANEVNIFHHTNEYGAYLSSMRLSRFIRENFEIERHSNDPAWLRLNAQLPAFYQFTANVNSEELPVFDRSRDGITLYYEPSQNLLACAVAREFEQWKEGTLSIHVIPVDKTSTEASTVLNGEDYLEIKMSLMRPDQPWEPNYAIRMVEMPDFEIKSIRFGPSRTQQLSFDPWWEYIGVKDRLKKLDR